MAESFNAAPITTTFLPVPNAGLDNHININGSSASWGSIASDTFLPVPNPGAEQTLLKGTQCTKVTGNEFVRVEGNRDVKIVGKLNTKIDTGETRDVKVSRDTTVAILDKTTINGNGVTTINGNLNRSIMQTYTDTVIGARISNEPSQWFDYGWFKLKIAGLDLEAVAVKAETQGVKLEAMGMHLDASYINNENVAIKLSTGLLALLLTVGRPKIGVAKPDFGGVSTHAWYVGV